jgi:hypothetical protein
VNVAAKVYAHVFTADEANVADAWETNFGASKKSLAKPAGTTWHHDTSREPVRSTVGS